MPGPGGQPTWIGSSEQEDVGIGLGSVSRCLIVPPVGNLICQVIDGSHSVVGANQIAPDPIEDSLLCIS